MNELTDKHYLQAVTELGDTRNIVANKDIYSERGILLVAAGVTISSSLYERLVKHVLLKPLDLSLSTDDMVDAEMLWNDVQDLVRKNSKLAKMVAIVDKGFPLCRTIFSIQMPVPLAFKLTVAREKFPKIYQNSLSILIISAYLARCDGMNLEAEGNVATAALFHDIGMMHIDPALLDPAHVMNGEQRKHLYAHPLTAYLLLREFPELPNSISGAVLEHHERMDGRGYPRGLQGNRISRHAQLLGIAEVVDRAMALDSPAEQWQKLEVMLKLNSKQYGDGLIGFLSTFWEKSNADATVSPSDPDELVSQVRQIAKLFADFELHANDGTDDKIYDFAQTRLAELRLALLGAGFDPHDPDELIQRCADDPGSWLITPRCSEKRFGNLKPWFRIFRGIGRRSCGREKRSTLGLA